MHQEQKSLAHTVSEIMRKELPKIILGVALFEGCYEAFHRGSCPHHSPSAGFGNC